MRQAVAPRLHPSHGRLRYHAGRAHGDAAATAHEHGAPVADKRADRHATAGDGDPGVDQCGHAVAVQALTPPQRFRPFHAKYLEAMALYAGAADDVGYFIDHIATVDGQARVPSALQKVQEGSHRLAEAQALFPKL